MATWSVISTQKEDLEVTLRFVDFYLSAGAEKIYLFLYDPADPAADVLVGHPKIELTLCDEAYWQEHIGKKFPGAHTTAQNFNANKSYRGSSTDWSLHVDADEFVIAHESNQSVGELLDLVDADVEVVRVQPTEPIICADQNYEIAFLLMPEQRNRLKVSEQFDGKTRKCGMVGHCEGKSFTRTGITNIEQKIHFPQPLSEVSKIWSESLTVVHFLNFGPRNWAEKLSAQIEANTFSKLRNTRSDFMKRILETYHTGGINDVAKIFIRARYLDDQQLTELMRLTKLFEYPFDFLGEVQAEFVHQARSVEEKATLLEAN